MWGDETRRDCGLSLCVLIRRDVGKVGWAVRWDGQLADGSSSLPFSPSLRHNQIGDVGTQNLAALLPRLPGLRKLE